MPKVSRQLVHLSALPGPAACESEAVAVAVKGGFCLLQSSGCFPVSNLGCCRYFMRPTSATPGDAKCYFSIPVLVSMEATGDSCSSNITTSISNAMAYYLEQTLGFYQGALAPGTATAQTDCVAAVSAKARLGMGGL